MKFGRAFRRAVNKQKRAEMIRTTGEAVSRDIAREMGLDPAVAVVRGPPKELHRLFEKADGRCNGVIEDVNDVERSRTLFSDPKQFLVARKLFAQHDSNPSDFVQKWANRGVTVKEFEDNYWERKPHGFIGANLVLEITKRGVTEFYEDQFMHERMQLTDEMTHEMYEETRKIIEGALIRSAIELRNLGEILDIPKDEKARRALAESLMTEDEKEAVHEYENSIRSLYAADRRNYDLMCLKNPNEGTKFDRLQFDRY